MNATLDDVFELAEQLEAEQQNLLIYRLRLKQMQTGTSSAPIHQTPHAHDGDGFAHHDSEHVEFYRNPDREELLDVVNRLRQTASDPHAGLMGKYANAAIAEISAEDFHAHLYSITTEWEQELDEFDTDNAS